MDSSCAGTKIISDRAFVHTQNADFGSIFVPGRPLCYFGLESESLHPFGYIGFRDTFLSGVNREIEPKRKSTTRSEDWILVERWRRFWAILSDNNDVI